ncbi:MAG TPA: hypothetical protein VM204_05575, partial [Gaiellaceae bacterium]|nr:hypothetical protein [Gaiellaceae bacterium]
MNVGRHARAIVLLAPGALVAALISACGAQNPGMLPASDGDRRGGLDGGAHPFAATSATPALPKPVPASMITHGTRAADLPRRPPPPEPACSKEERRALTFEHPPSYTDKIEKDGTFTARLFVGNAATCTREIALPLSFTPPKSTATKTVDFGAYVRPGGAFVEITLDAAALAEAGVTPGRHAITFAVLDEDGKPAGKALSGNAFRFGRDEVAIAAAPKVPARIGVAEELVVPLAVQNVGDTSNKVTPLIVFTRPGETRGIEHYDPPQLVVPGASSLAIHLPPEA